MSNQTRADTSVWFMIGPEERKPYRYENRSDKARYDYVGAGASMTRGADGAFYFGCILPHGVVDMAMDRAILYTTSVITGLEQRTGAFLKQGRTPEQNFTDENDCITLPVEMEEKHDKLRAYIIPHCMPHQPQDMGPHTQMLCWRMFSKARELEIGLEIRGTVYTSRAFAEEPIVNPVVSPVEAIDRHPFVQRIDCASDEKSPELQQAEVEPYIHLTISADVGKWVPITFESNHWLDGIIIIPFDENGSPFKPDNWKEICATMVEVHCDQGFIAGGSMSMLQDSRMFSKIPLLKPSEPLSYVHMFDGYGFDHYSTDPRRMYFSPDSCPPGMKVFVRPVENNPPIKKVDVILLLRNPMPVRGN